MFINYQTQGIIIKKEDRGEADQVFTIYTKDFGKLEILGRGIRKISSKLRSGADIFYLSDIEFIQGKTHKTLTDAIVIEKFENLKKNLGIFKIAHKIVEVFDELVQGEERDEKLWNLLKEIFQKLNNLSLPAYNELIIYYYFLWNFLSLLGYKPELYNCSICQKKLQPEILYFNPKEGGVICHQCFRKIKKGKKISLETIKILRILLEKNWQILERLKIDPENLKSLKLISDYFFLSLKREIIGNS